MSERTRVRRGTYFLDEIYLKAYGPLNGWSYRLYDANGQQVRAQFGISEAAAKVAVEAWERRGSEGSEQESDLRKAAVRIAAMNPTTFDSEVAPSMICFFCGTYQGYDFKADKYIEEHADDCDLVLLREALEKE